MMYMMIPIFFSSFDFLIFFVVIILLIHIEQLIKAGSKY